ncbi:unnamed protein product [Ilex paraguariensis]|uniref:Uncharacterized protein n=1 Tax=Ilex paraguariensis TaxID=185542 RepID=A0ABC8RE44_9AQUA
MEDEKGKGGRTVYEQFKSKRGSLAMDNSVVGDAGGTRLKRRWKPSEKGLELQAEKVKKPLQKVKPGKSSRNKSKSVVEDETDIYEFAGDVSNGYH